MYGGRLQPRRGWANPEPGGLAKPAPGEAGLYEPPGGSSELAPLRGPDPGQARLPKVAIHWLRPFNRRASRLKLPRHHAWRRAALWSGPAGAFGVATGRRRRRRPGHSLTAAPIFGELPKKFRALSRVRLPSGNLSWHRAIPQPIASRSQNRARESASGQRLRLRSAELGEPAIRATKARGMDEVGSLTRHFAAGPRSGREAAVGPPLARAAGQALVASVPTHDGGSQYMRCSRGRQGTTGGFAVAKVERCERGLRVWLPPVAQLLGL